MEDRLRRTLDKWQEELGGLLREVTGPALAELQARLMREMLSEAPAVDLLSALGRGQAATPYRVLGLDLAASDAVVKLVYRHLAREHHPDRGGDHERMAEINRAYQEIARQRGWTP